MRIGTWNLAGRWSEKHEGFLRDADCDIWLLTEVNERVDVAGYHRHLGAGVMAAKRRWAGVHSRAPLTPLPDPHPASAAAVLDGITYCSTILPWRSCGAESVWVGALHADRTGAAVDDLLGALPTRSLVWGGDWNHALSGPEHSGSKGGRAHILAALDKLGLEAPTAGLAHRIDPLLSIDHIAVGRDQPVHAASRIRADGLSDHDAYVVELAQPDAPGEATT